ncbi:hypothetical protein GJ744_009566 [Endocarpon pusillum]|uniref:Uncharacterized protein n=1 Tax=Endocarpon pusillum TaxID=364733 RepID=A0A8H7AFH5_9EURO|nr:hypothetical protein GJ744_009566 [Endocarpon pusillum]
MAALAPSGEVLSCLSEVIYGNWGNTVHLAVRTPKSEKPDAGIRCSPSFDFLSVYPYEGIWGELNLHDREGDHQIGPRPSGLKSMSRLSRSMHRKRDPAGGC